MSDTAILIEGLYFGEGPRWHADRLWFSDFYAHAVKSVDESGDVRIELELDDQPSGLGWLPDGRLLVVAMKERAVKRLDSSGLVLHADISELTAHLCNDMVVDADGSAWVGNFGFNLDADLKSRGGEVFSDHPVANLVRVDADGSVHVAAKGLHFPNGSVITPDGNTLIVAETLAGCLTAFTINADKSLTNRRIWAPLPGVAPDGICLNEHNQVWVANAVGPEVLLIAEGGDVVARVVTGQPCYACMLGGCDGKTLFAVTAEASDGERAAAAATGKIETVRVDAARAGWP
ncbi:MAG: SMP-30/gluconolactonase/LRE family protein [Halioglobus sp.]|nr:SMP-30/gluconolactonase/LRE family protein [Halioglobus sp.]